jgi:PAS domain S-box-containing protein
MLREAYTQGRPISGRSVRLQRAGEIGRERYFDYMLQPVTDNSGAVAGVFVEAHDVTDRVVTDAEHRRREESLRLAVDAGRMAVVEVDLTTHEVDETPELRRLWGVWTQGPLILEDLQALILPEELARLHGLVADAHLRGASFFEAEYQYKRADTGAVRWMLARGRPIQSGAARKFMGVLMDVTDRREAQERLLLLAKEVDHRANNLLSTVQSIVSLTRSEDILEFRESVLGRILALAHTHRLLAESGWAGASLKRVVSEELRPFATTDQIRVEGEDIKLTPAVAQGVAVALHELATNAAKYGALSVQDGVVDLTWTRPKARGLVEMDWRERGGPEVRPPSRAGFGSNLLRRALSGAIGGSVALDWRADGLHCSLRFPPGSDGPQPAR